LREVDDNERSGGRGTVIALAAYPVEKSETPAISFDRTELDQILRVYGRKVAAGEWRDYAIDQLAERAVFSVYRRASEVPLYKIVKQPKLARRLGAYSVVAAGGAILKRGHDLANVLKALDGRLRVVATA
jgi:hypothetical protein